ncbi:alkaline phosphatase [uncultured Algimonas sp.]|uniref:alkaline phosphatase n=1 Tax=uncultured Algimonas sp. TaxID=1547920 RepID=UPI002612120D|nr:alkaline phosphatase [uncultured Algimonas sp.]
MSRLVYAASAIALLTAAESFAQSAVLPANQTGSGWYTDARAKVDAKAAQMSAFQPERARNVILFVGDGMGISTQTAARIRQGQLAGQPGEEGLLSFEGWPNTALVKTYNVNAQTPDSAGTMTAMMSGLKTDVGVIGVDADVERGDCASAKGNEVVTALELAEIRGMSTGIVSTARITHATPAATYAKSPDRNWEDVSDMSDEAVAAGCIDIATQLVEFETWLEKRYPGIDVDGIEVAMGGGRRHFLPKEASANSPDARSEVEGDRTDGRNLTTEWAERYADGVYIFDKAGFDALPADAGRVLGLFNESHMQYAADIANDVSGEPSIVDMTIKAIDILDDDPDGFFLMVESGRIDHAHHAGNAAGALSDTIAFADAIEAAVNATDPAETLILVTADHGHVMTIGGYPKRGNPILGKIVLVGQTDPATAEDGLPVTTLLYNNGRGFRDLGANTNSDASYGLPVDAGRKDLAAIDTTTPGYHQEALVPLSSETHSAEDIGLFATGPGSQLAQGTVEQSVVFHIMNEALGLVE